MGSLGRLLLAAALLSGCTSPVHAEELVVEEVDAPSAGYARVPDGVRPRDEPRPQPVQTPAPKRIGGDRPRFVVRQNPDEGSCWSVARRGFPAIRSDGQQVAAIENQVYVMSRFPGGLDLALFDTGDFDAGDSDEPSARMPVYDDRDPIDADDDDCRDAFRRIRKRARTANTILQASDWRSMTRLSVQLGDRSLADFAEDPNWSAAHRPVQVVARGGELIVRVPGVRLLGRDPIPPHLHGAHVDSVHADLATGMVVVTYSYCNGESCTCDPKSVSQVLHWEPELFAAIAERPCPKPGSDDDDDACKADLL